MTETASRLRAPTHDRGRAWVRLSLLALVSCTIAGAHAQAQVGDGVPRTENGRPDMHGIWSSRWLTPVERPASVDKLILDAAEAETLKAEILARADANNLLDPELSNPDGDSLAIVRGEYRSSLLISPENGKMPFTGAGRSAMFAYVSGLDGPEQRMTTERCIGGVGWAPLQIRSANMLHRIVQTDDHFVLHTEAYDDLRIIPFDGLHMPAAVTSPTGDSVATWEGDTLVVETKNIDPDFSVRGIVTVMSPDAEITEWFDLVREDELVYRYTITDPAYYSQPWTVEYSLERTPQDMYEFACHEANYSLHGMLYGARLEERESAAGQ